MRKKICRLCNANCCLLSVFIVVLVVQIKLVSYIVYIGFIKKSLISVYPINLTYSNTSYLCPLFDGRLGNHMFQYASLYGISKRKHMVVVLEENDLINKVFPKLDISKVKTSVFICENAFLFREDKACSYDTNTFNYGQRKVVKQKGFLQSWKYFYNHKEDIRRQFVFKPEVQAKAQNIIDSSMHLYAKRNSALNNLQVIGVHIRRGDYLHAQNIKYGYTTATKEYIEKSLGYFRSLFEKCAFIVFVAPNQSDMKWRDEHVKGNDVIHVSPNSPEVDMCALSKCNHTIITVGSYGWWSAWLANGIAVYFKDVAKPNSTLRNAFSHDMSDYFPPEWIGF